MTSKKRMSLSKRISETERFWSHLLILFFLMLTVLGRKKNIFHLASDAFNVKHSANSENSNHFKDTGSDFKRARAQMLLMEINGNWIVRPIHIKKELDSLASECYIWHYVGLGINGIFAFEWNGIRTLLPKLVNTASATYIHVSEFDQKGKGWMINLLFSVSKFFKKKSKMQCYIL